MDLIEAAGLWDESEKITKVLGRCSNETGGRATEKSDWAYRLSERSQISLSTGQFFPNGFPQDFSLLLVIKPTLGKMLRRSNVFLFF